MTGAILGAGAFSGISGGGYPDGTVLYHSPSTFSGAWSVIIPAGVPFIWIEGWGGGGCGSLSGHGPDSWGNVAGPGGGGGGYFKTHVAVSAGIVIAGVIGAAGNYTTSPVPAGSTTVNANSSISLAAATGYGGGYGRFGGSPGSGGTATGGSLTNTSGHAGGLTNPWDGGGSGNGGGDQTIQGYPATLPGGGGPGGPSFGGSPVSGANGQIIVTVKTS